MTLRPVYDISPFTLLDFPDHMAAIVWMAGCNMRCPYCHNGHIATAEGSMDIEDVEAFLKTRLNLLDGVVISGGEPTLYAALPAFCERIREMGFKIKLDTNGSNPAMVEKLLQYGLLDYVAVDYKAPEEKYVAVTGQDFHDKVITTIVMLQKSGMAFEVRTTYHSDLLDTEDLRRLQRSLKDLGVEAPFYVQNYRRSDRQLGELGPHVPLLEPQLPPGVLLR